MAYRAAVGTESEEMNYEPPTHLDLFSGVAGFSIAFEREGFRTIGFAEIDPYASAVLKKHWPDVPNYGDVRNVPTLKCDVLTCGDPCQRNSNAWRNGDGAQSPAVYALQVIAKCRPSFVIRENPSRVRSDAPWPWWKFRAELESLGYSVLPVRFRSCCIGADHQRERLLLLAELQNPDSTGLERNVGEVVARENQRRCNSYFTRSDWGHATPRISRATDGIPNRTHRIRCLGNSVVPAVVQTFAKAIYQSLTL